MAVGADQRIAGDAEAFQMYLVTDAVAWFGQPDAVAFGGTLDEEMIIKIFWSRLQHIVVDIGNGQFGFDPV